MTQRWRLELIGKADIMEFPDEAPPEEVRAAIEKRLTEMCDDASAYYWRELDKRGLNPLPVKFR